MEEYTLGEIVKTIDKFVKILKKNLIIIVSLLVISGAIGYYYSKQTKPTYISESAIMLDNQSSGGGIRGLASEFGFGSKLGVNEEKLIRIILSRELVMNCLQGTIEINGERRIVVNEILKNFYEQKSIEGKLIEKLPSHWDPLKKPSLADTLLYKAGTVVLKNNISATEEKDGTISITTKFHNPHLSYNFHVEILHAIKQYFIASELGKERVTISVLENRADSIYQELLQTEHKLAEYRDANLKTIKAVGTLKEFKLRRTLSINNILYTEVIKNLEVARFNFLNKKSSIHIIDNPTIPEMNILSPVFGIFVGLLIGVFLSVIVIFFKEVKVKTPQ